MLLRRYSSFLHISLVLTWNMILFEAKYHFKKAIFIGTIFLWNVFLFWVIWFTYSSDKMSTLDTIVKDYDKNIVLRDCQRQAFEYLHDKKGDLLVTTFGTTFETFTEIESLQGPTTLYGRLVEPHSLSRVVVPATLHLTRIIQALSVSDSLRLEMMMRSAVNFIGGGNQRNPPTCCKSPTNFITEWCIRYTSPERDSNSQR